MERGAEPDGTHSADGRDKGDMEMRIKYTDMKMHLVLLFLLIFQFALANTSDDVASLVQNERNFAKTAAEHGTRAAFLTFLADDSVLFRPTAVNGKQWMESHSARPGLLSWEPMQAEVSGNLGYTTGPWEYRQDPSAGKADGYGYFITVWKKQPDGAWKAVIDHGISSPPPASSPGLRMLSFAEPKNDSNPEKLKEQLIKLDQKFTIESYPLLGIDYGASVYRDNASPVRGKEAIAGAVTSVLKGSVSWQPAKADVATTGNLGYTYGTCSLNSTKANYLRIWRRQPNGSWKYVIDVATPAQ